MDCAATNTEDAEAKEQGEPNVLKQNNKTRIITFVKGPAPLCSMSAPRRAGMMDATMMVTKAPRIARGACWIYTAPYIAYQ